MIETPMPMLTERNIHHYARALVEVHGKNAPYMAAIHAIARRECREPDASRLWLAVGEKSAAIIAGSPAGTLH